MAVRQADISGKPVSFRLASAEGRIRLRPETVELLRTGRLEKGDAVSIAKTMGVMAAKKTSEVLALCHPLRIELVQMEVEVRAEGVEVRATVSAHEKTGVEMEALTAVSIALLNIWDVVKAYEKDENGQYPETAIQEIRVTRKVKRPEGS